MPWGSALFAGIALALVVALPTAVLAWLAWRGEQRADPTHMRPFSGSAPTSLRRSDQDLLYSFGAFLAYGQARRHAAQQASDVDTTPPIADLAFGQARRLAT